MPRKIMGICPKWNNGEISTLEITEFNKTNYEDLILFSCFSIVYSQWIFVLKFPERAILANDLELFIKTKEIHHDYTLFKNTNVRIDLYESEKREKVLFNQFEIPFFWGIVTFNASKCVEFLGKYLCYVYNNYTDKTNKDAFILMIEEIYRIYHNANTYEQNRYNETNLYKTWLDIKSSSKGVFPTPVGGLK